jgi:hypothetical protein
MGTEDITAVSSPQLAAVAKLAGNAAASSAADAVAAAAANAAKPGGQSTEFKATIAAVALTGAVAGLKVFALIPGPWTVPAVLALAGIYATTAAYSLSRGSVKKAALAGAAAVVAAAVRPPPAARAVVVENDPPPTGA